MDEEEYDKHNEMFTLKRSFEFVESYRKHMEFEKEQVELATMRRSAATVAFQFERKDAIKDIPDGYGDNSYFHKYCLPLFLNWVVTEGCPIYMDNDGADGFMDALWEMTQLARILNRPITAKFLHYDNDIEIVANVDSDPEQLYTYYMDQGLKLQEDRL